MKRTSVLCLVLLIGATIAFSGCKKKEAAVATPPSPAIEATAPPMAPVGARIERLTSAKGVNADDSPGETTSNFAANETVYVSMWTADAPVGTEIRARWIGPDGKQFNEDRIVTDTAGDGYTSFYARNRNGWDKGTYRVEILLNGQPAGSTTFTVN